MNNNKTYIIILNYNGWQDTIECLESVLRNDCDNYQVIVVDNNSPNKSLDYIKTWAEGKLEVNNNDENPLKNLSYHQLNKPIPYIFYNRVEAESGGNKHLEEIHYNNMPKGITTKYPLIFIQSSDNLGFASGNNIAIRYTIVKNDYENIILLNNDTVIKRNSLSELIKAKEIHGDNAIYGGRIYYYSNPHKIWYDGGHFNEWLGRTTHINKGKINIMEKAIHEVNFITFCLVLIPKKIIENIGLLDESYFMYVEDLDYSYRVWKSGYKLYHVSSAQIYHKVGSSSGEEISEFSAYWMMRNRIKIIRKSPFFKMILSLIFLITTRIVRYIIWHFKYNNIIKAQIRGIKDGFKI